MNLTAELEALWRTEIAKAEAWLAHLKAEFERHANAPAPVAPPASTPEVPAP